MKGETVSTADLPKDCKITFLAAALSEQLAQVQSPQSLFRDGRRKLKCFYARQQPAANLCLLHDDSGYPIPRIVRLRGERPTSIWPAPTLDIDQLRPCAGRLRNHIIAGPAIRHLCRRHVSKAQHCDDIMFTGVAELLGGRGGVELAHSLPVRIHSRRLSSFGRKFQAGLNRFMSAFSIPKARETSNCFHRLNGSGKVLMLTRWPFSRATRIS